MTFLKIFYRTAQEDMEGWALTFNSSHEKSVFAFIFRS